MKPSKLQLVNAQKESIPVRGEITLPVEFGRRVFQWTFAIVDNLFCPAILGVNVLHKGCINFNKRRVKISGECMPIVFTLRELG